MLTKRITSARRTRITGLALAVVVAVVSPAALGTLRATPKIVGNAKAGKAIFATNCAVCHTLKAAKSKGTLGPPLDKYVLPEATLIKAVTKGGASVATKAVLAKYRTPMPAYKGVLSTAQINNVAAFVYVSTHK
jgi:mono/diheme cytochrome c family protein